MNTPTAHTQISLIARRATRPIRRHADPSPAQAAFHALRPARAGHDFLVPNPRPDLITDANTLRMIECG